MEGMIIIRDKKTGDILQTLNIWIIFYLLKFWGKFHWDLDGVKIYIDEEEVPMLESMQNHG